MPGDLANVVAIAAGGDPFTGDAYTLALKSDGTVVAWGTSQVVAGMAGLTNVFAIAGGEDYALAIRSGPPTPVLTLEPTGQYQTPGGNVTFTAMAEGLYGVTYQWQFDGTNILGATNAELTLTNVQAMQSGSYDVVISDTGGMGTIVSSNADLTVTTLVAPVILAETNISDEGCTFRWTAVPGAAGYCLDGSYRFRIS